MFLLRFTLAFRVAVPAAGLPRSVSPPCAMYYRYDELLSHSSSMLPNYVYFVSLELYVLFIELSVDGVSAYFT